MVSRTLYPLVGFGYSNIVYIPISITLVLSPGAIFKLGTIHHIQHHGMSSRMYACRMYVLFGRYYPL